MWPPDPNQLSDQWQNTIDIQRSKIHLRSIGDLFYTIFAQSHPDRSLGSFVSVVFNQTRDYPTIDVCISPNDGRPTLSIITVWSNAVLFNLVAVFVSLDW